MSEEQIATFIICFAFVIFVVTFITWAIILIVKKIKIKKILKKL